MKWKIAAILVAAALLVGAMPMAIDELQAEDQTAALSSHDSAHALVQSTEHLKRSLSLRDVVAVGAHTLQLDPPTGQALSFTHSLNIPRVSVRSDSPAIRAPPQA